MKLSLLALLRKLVGIIEFLGSDVGKYDCQCLKMLDECQDLLNECREELKSNLPKKEKK